MSTQPITTLSPANQDIPMDEITITKAGPADIDQLQSISKTTFTETFSQYNSEQNMTHYLNESLSKSRLSAELMNEGSEFYFARLAKEVIGYLKVNVAPAQTDLQDVNSFEIERIYVLQEYQGKKVGQLLFKYAISLAQQRKSQYIWLGVWEHNAKAIRFYEKNGFIPFSSHAFKLGDDEQTDILMKKELR